MKLFRPTRRGKRGSALVVVMMFVLVFSLVIAAIMSQVSQQTRQTHRSRVLMNSLEGARASLNAYANNAIYMIQTRPPNQLGGVITSLNDVVHELTPSKPDEMKWVENEAGKKLTYIKDRGPNDFQFRENIDPNEPWYGYSTAKLDYEIVSFLCEDSNSADLMGFKGMGVRQRVTIDYIPFYQFAIFYENEMDLHPGPVMNVRGRVHSNEDMYLTCNDKLIFWEKVTCAGSIYRMMKTESGTNPSGHVYFKVPKSGSTTQFNDVDMRNPPTPNNGDAYFDHRDTQVWYQGALDRWKQRVLDKSHGISAIRPPLPAGSEMYDLLRRADDADTPDVKNIKLEYQACLIVTGDPGTLSTIKMYKQAVSAEGVRTLTEVTSAITKAIVSTGLFYDGHQQTIVRTLDIDMAALTAMSGMDWDSSSGVVYVSTTPNGATDDWSLSSLNEDSIPVKDSKGEITFDKTTLAPNVTFKGWMNSGDGSLAQAKARYMPAVRVVNAAKLPRNASKGFALYTDRPLYVAGNVNTTDKATAVLGGESLTVTSVPLWLAELDLGKNDTTTKTPDGIPDTSADGKKTILASGNPNYPSGAQRVVGYTREMGDSWKASRYKWDKGKWWTTSSGSITQNVIYLMGNTPSVHAAGHQSGETDLTMFSGGAHNVMRYLEYWSGTHTINGSMIILFPSPVAMHKFRCCDSKGYYNPPTRNYNWDSSLKDSEPPPGMPVFIEVTVNEAELVDYAYAAANAP